MQVTLSRRQHIVFNVGAQLPINEREERKPQAALLLPVGLVRRRSPRRMVDEPPMWQPSIALERDRAGFSLRLGRCAHGGAGRAGAQPAPRPVVTGHRGSLFVTSENCIACHNGLSTSGGEDISIGTSWRATMMANSSRDPYWQAGVRREIIDHPDAAAAIEHECSVCHMPMSHTARASRHDSAAKVFEHLPLDQRREEMDLLAADGVSCAVCHQIQPDRLGTPESFTGGYVIDTTTPFEKRRGLRALQDRAAGRRRS